LDCCYYRYGNLISALFQSDMLVILQAPPNTATQSPIQPQKGRQRHPNHHVLRLASSFIA